jgi:hypothetical protein
MPHLTYTKFMASVCKFLKAWLFWEGEGGEYTLEVEEIRQAVTWRLNYM